MHAKCRDGMGDLTSVNAENVIINYHTRSTSSLASPLGSMIPPLFSIFSHRPIAVETSPPSATRPKLWISGRDPSMFPMLAV